MPVLVLIQRVKVGAILFSNPSILILFAAQAAVGPDEAPLGEWSVVRQRTGGKGEEGRGVGRKLTVTAWQVVERRADSYEVRPLSSDNNS